MFEEGKAIVEPQRQSDKPVAAPPTVDTRDTLIVPANVDGFNEVFLGQNCWYAVRISGGMLPKIRWIAGYQTQPISAITHVAPVDHIERYGDGTKYKVVFSEPAKPIGPVKFGDAPKGWMKGTHYTSYERLLKAKTLPDLM